jgi:hypothetical protein
MVDNAGPVPKDWEQLLRSMLVIRCFENEVKAQSGKHLDGNAVAILQTGAEVALNDLQ